MTIKIHNKLLVIVLVSAAFSAIQFTAYLKGSTPYLIQAIASIVFLLLWIGYGVMNRRSYKPYVLASSLFWLVGFILVAASEYVDGNLVMLAAFCLWPGPLYGLWYFTHWPSNLDGALFVMYIGFGCSMLGVLAGVLLRRSRSRGA